MYPVYDENNKKFCAYLRKSRADRDAELRGEGDTLARHRQLLEDFSAKIKLPIEFFRKPTSRLCFFFTIANFKALACFEPYSRGRCWRRRF